MAIEFINWHTHNVPHRAVIDAFNDDYHDQFLVYHNTENDKYAVYYYETHNGCVCALNDHFKSCMLIRDNVPDSLLTEVMAVYAKEAMEYGFPVTWHDIDFAMGMRWRDVRDAINEMPEDRLNDLARVWIPGDVHFSGDAFPTLSGISPYDGYEKPSAENFYSFNIVEE